MQVLVNLLGNAVKFSPEGARVLVKGRKQGNHVRVEVRDRGRGIPEDKIGQVFDRFYQVQAKEDRGLKSKNETGETKVSGQGTGLGLSICKNIVELHGGKIGVFAGEEGGCVFWFTIPCSNQAQ
ncbi:MAG: Alginate biosynthesis sensor protein KinB [bacterium ADurb.Bin425]|nr:MAG: Alginate biosynthesis sensor protein KinB [bacterium ADurb.Bin425]